MLNAESVLYSFRNDLWKAGGELLESEYTSDQKMGQLMTDLGYLLANHYQENPEAMNDDTWRENMRESMKGSARFAWKTCQY